MKTNLLPVVAGLAGIISTVVDVPAGSLPDSRCITRSGANTAQHASDLNSHKTKNQ